MDGTMADALREWHDLYLLIGTACATLIGLMFVAASIGASYFNTEREAGLRSFLTPTVLHFTAALVSCVLASAPIARWLGGILLAGGLAGIAYALWVARQMHRRGFTHTIDWEDRFWYVLAPLVSYAVMTAGALLLLRHSALGFDLLALSLLFLLLLGIRNAWDMTVWIVIRTER